MDGLSLLLITFTAIISIVFPIGLIVYFKKKHNASLLYFLVGVTVFTIVQIVIRIPLIEWLSDQFWFSRYIGNNKVATAYKGKSLFDCDKFTKLESLPIK